MNSCMTVSGSVKPMDGCTRSVLMTVRKFGLVAQCKSNSYLEIAGVCEFGSLMLFITELARNLQCGEINAGDDLSFYFHDGDYGALIEIG